MDTLEGEELVKIQAEFWKKQEPTVDGMLGGYGRISEVDEQGSVKFLKSLQAQGTVGFQNKALDCGAGIGRVAKQVLLPAGYKSVDLLDVNDDFLQQAKKDIPQISETFCCGMAEFDFSGHTWDLIWVQWCIIYLTDDAFIRFFTRAKAALNKGGVIVIKDNVLARFDDPEMDTEDMSVTRSDNHLRTLLKKAGLTLISCKRQGGFPEELYPVMMYALQ